MPTKEQVIITHFSIADLTEPGGVKTQSLAGVEAVMNNQISLLNARGIDTLTIVGDGETGPDTVVIPQISSGYWREHQESGQESLEEVRRELVFHPLKYFY